MARTDPIFRLRVPPELVERFRKRAAANGRSMAQEIVIALEAALDQESDVEVVKDVLATVWKRVHALEAKVFEGTGYPWPEDFDPEFDKYREVWASKQAATPKNKAVKTAKAVTKLSAPRKQLEK
jgi:predicted HicB family RNase H-like nuclease